ncbi:MAG TPA: ferritin family protein [Anaerolineae bacterium]|nr:ferritin family protein [Anaerolineae bacterium]
MEEQNGALVVLLRAIQNEIAGQRFYDDAARYCIDPWAKELLSTLAQDEEAHAQLLLGQHAALRSGVGWLDLEQAMARGAAADLGRLTFPAEEPSTTLFPSGWTPDQALERGADDLSALAVGIEIEKMAIALYQRESDAARDPGAQEAYGFLVQEERRHYRLLTTSWERLSGTSWEEG